MKEMRCAICRNDTDYKVLYRQKIDENTVNKVTFSARRMPDRCHYQIVKCGKCGLIYSTPILDSAEIDKLYHASTFTYESVTDYLNDTYGFYLKSVAKLVPEKGKLLEIGCGNGFFMEKALELGYREVYGVEPSFEAIQHASPSVSGTITNSIFKADLYPESFFDVICFFQTLDHIVDPNEFLSNCRNYLKPGGVALCITHDIKSLAAKILGEKCPMIDIEHIYLFNKKTLRRIFLNNGFEVISVFDVANIFPLWYYFRLFPFPDSLKEGMIRFLKRAGIGNARLRTKPGNIGIVARRPRV